MRSARSNLINLILSISCLASLPISAHAQSNEGTRFWFSFMEHYDIGQNQMVVMVTSKYNTTGSVRIPLQNWEQPFSVSANEVSIIQLPASVENYGSENISNKGVVVTAILPVSVYTHQYHNSRSEATLVLPETATDREYYMLAYTGYSNQNLTYPSEMLLVGMQDSTDISVVLSTATASGKNAGDTLKISLNAGQTYQIQAASAIGDVTATYVQGNKRFNAFAGARWTQVPSGCDYRDNLLEQMYPVSTWGKQFVTAPFAKMPYDIFRILASKDNTTVAVQTANTTLQYKLNKGQFAEYQQTEASLITASQPVAVAQYLIGSGCSGYPIGDPSILLLNSVEQIRDTVTLYNSSFENIQENYINIVTKTIDYPLTTLDNQPLDTYSPTLRIVGNDSLFTIASVKLNAGTHTILSRGCGIIASAYGYGPVESYAYGGGASFKAISANSLIPPGGCLPDTLLFDTRLTPPRHSFRWDLGDGTSSNEATFRHYYGKLGTFKVKLYLTDNCLNRTDTLERDVKITLRQAATVGVDPAGCVGESAEFFATDIEGATYQWSGPNNFASQQQYPIIDNLNSEMAGTYQVVGSVSGCETFPAFNTLTVYPLPSPQLGNDTLTCSANFFPLLYLNPGSFSTYIWQNNSGNNTFTVVEAGDYWVEVTDLNGCQNRDSVAVFEQCPTKYYAPNVFSPDGDGLNDYFSIEGTDIRTLTLHIFDRWGNKVFSSTQTDAKWDGYIQGEKGPPGVYVWVARIGGYLQDASQFEKTDSGNVTLVR